MSRGISKGLIIERLSSRVYHFLPLENMVRVSQKNALNLSVATYKRDIELTKGYKYFLSLSRTPSTQVGYQKYRILTDKNWKTYVRIEFDGDLLNNNYKGHATNYYNNYNKDARTKEKRQKLNKRVLHQNNDYFDTEDINYLNDDFKLYHLSEYEDRLLSNNSQLLNIDKYIKRIDIYVPLTKTGNININYSTYCKFIYDKFPGKVFIYVNDRDFNYNKENFIDINNLKIKNNLDNTNKLFYKSLCSLVSYYLLWIKNSDEKNKYIEDIYNQIKKIIVDNNENFIDLITFTNTVNTINTGQMVANKSFDNIKRKTDKGYILSKLTEIQQVLTNKALQYYKKLIYPNQVTKNYKSYNTILGKINDYLIDNQINETISRFYYIYNKLK